MAIYYDYIISSDLLDQIRVVQSTFPIHWTSKIHPFRMGEHFEKLNLSFNCNDLSTICER